MWRIREDEQHEIACGLRSRCDVDRRAACEKKGALEQAGEEVDEAIDTAKHGGDESTENKVDDAIDEAREAVEEK